MALVLEIMFRRCDDEVVVVVVVDDDDCDGPNNGETGRDKENGPEAKNVLLLVVVVVCRV